MSDLHTTFRPERIDRPESVIAAVPWLLGFVPQLSVVLVLISKGALVCTLRADLADVVRVPEQLVCHAGPVGADAAIAVVVDEHGASCRMCAETRSDLISALNTALEARGIELYGAYAVDRIATGGRWSCFDGCGSGGVIDDPEQSPVAAAAKAAGRTVYATREDAVAPITATCQARSTRLAELIAVTRAGEARGPEHAGDAVTHAIGTVRSVAAGSPLDDADAAQLALALVDLQVRDALLGLTISVEAGAAADLWMQLSQILPEPWRAETLTMAGFSAYIDGDGARAMEAFEAALRIDPGHRLAGMLNMALGTGIGPARMTELAMTGYQLGGQLSVEYPALADNEVAVSGA